MCSAFCIAVRLDLVKEGHMIGRGTTNRLPTTTTNLHAVKERNEEQERILCVVDDQNA